MVSSQLAIEAPVEETRLPHSIIGALIVFGLIGGALVAIGSKNYPDLHTILDTSMSLLSGALAVLLWDMGTRTDRSFPRWIAIGLAATALLEFLHVIVTVEWSSFLAPIATARIFLRPATWPPAAHVLPVAVGCAIWLMRRGSSSVLGFALAITVLSAGLLAAFQRLPTYTPPGSLGITRPALILAPVLWAVIGLVCWKLRATDRLLKPLALTAAVLCLANTAMPYSRAPHDEIAMVAHLGRAIGYFVLLLSLMKLASSDVIERIRAEAKLARLNEDLERRVLERTRELHCGYWSTAGGSR
jgi:hypothetical protein